MPSSRDPFPFPRIQNDDNFVGKRSSQKSPFHESVQEAQGMNPWNRLNRTPTLSSSRREIYHYDPRSPNDSLDFVIKSQYDHHNKFLSGNNVTLFQKETLSEDHGRILKNRKKEVPPPFNPEYPPLRVNETAKNESPHAIGGAIQSHHTAATNGGYSRRHDGGFYSI